MKTLIKILFIAVGVSGVAYAIAYLSKQAQLLKDTSFDVKNSSIKFNSITSVTVSITAAITNSSDVDFSIKSMSLDLYIGDTFLTHVDKNDVIALPKHGTAVADFASEFNPLQIFQNTIKVDTMRIKGTVSLSAGMLTLSSFPVDQTFSTKTLLS